MIKTQTTDLINKTEIEDGYERSVFLNKVFGNKCIVGEQLVYKWMDALCERYNGGYWSIYKLSNGGFYMAPSMDDVFTIYCPGFADEVDLSADAAGIVACLFAVNQLANQTNKDKIIDLYYRIRDYALKHPESAGIFRAID